MVHVHGPQVAAQVEAGRTAAPEQLVGVAVDAGKAEALALVADFAGQRLCAPVTFAMNREGIASLVDRVEAATAGREVARVRLGVEASGYHLPLLAGAALPPAWEVVEFNPAHVAAQRKVNGQRGVKTDAVDATAMFDLLTSGRGSPAGTADAAIVELDAWVAHRTRRVAAKQACDNRIMSLLDRAFPGVSGCAHRLLGTAAGRLVAAEFSDPARLARLGPRRFQQFCARRGVRVTAPKAGQLVEAARQALPAADAVVARQAIADELRLLGELEAQLGRTETQLARLLPATPFGVLTTTPGWATVRAAAYGAAVGDPARWPAAKKVYRASGLTPTIYESSGRRIDGAISREGSVPLRRALLELALGLRHHDSGARAYAAALAARGKPSGIIWCALAHRANRIAYAMVRDQRPYDPACWR